MKKIPTTGDRGFSGWAVEPEDHEAYFEHMARHWHFLARLWFWFRPPNTVWRIAYSRRDGGVSIVIPTPHMVALLKRGGVIRRMRQIDSLGPRGIPVFEGSGEFLPPLSEREAIEFIAWKDLPREVNHRAFLRADQIPQDRSRRNEWRLTEDGRIAVAA